MAKTWDDFLPLLSPHLSGCPNVTMKQYLGIVASDFFARTYLWRDQIDTIYATTGVVEYDLDGEAVIEDVISVVLNESTLDRTDLRLVATQNLGQTGEPREFWVKADRSIVLFPTPEENVQLKVYAVLKPSRTATGVEDWIYETWADTLVSGVVARLAMIPNKEWTDVATATSQKAMYERAVTNARIRDFRGINLQVRQRPAA
jgi:hypothetical protein